MEYEQLKQRISALLPLPEEFEKDRNLLSLGLNSLKIMRLVNALRKEGIKVSYGSLLEAPTLRAWHEIIEQAQKKGSVKEKDKTPCANFTGAFALTDVQYAYQVGRQDGRELGGVGCHAYMEFAGEHIDIDRLNKAWKKVQYHHPMLRAKFLSNGQQEISEKPYSEQIVLYDFSQDSDYAEKVKALGENLSHRKFQVEKGHVCAITLALLPNGKCRLFYDVDLLIADVQSFHIILRDLAAAYAGKPLPKDSENWSFANYLERKKRLEAEDMEAAKAYWNQRLETLPSAPELPLAKPPSAIQKTRTTRRSVTVGMQEWNAITQKAAQSNTTPAVYLMAVYALVIGSRSANKKFLLNVPLFDRHIEYGANENAVADFTTLLLLEIDLSKNPTFEELLHQIGKQLHEDMKHSCYSGVQVQRDMMSKSGQEHPVAPVVFACNFGNPLISKDFEQIFGEFRQMLSQTPGVWIDFQSYEVQNGILLTWDCVEELFPQGLLDDMMASLRKLIEDTAARDWNTHFDMLPEYQRQFVERQKHIAPVRSTERIFDGFLKSAERYEEKIAVIDTGTGKHVTYAELKKQALSVANYFVKHNIRGQAVAITLTRGCMQAVAALGILLSGNYYVPVGLHQPKQRRAAIHELIGISHVLCDETTYCDIQWPEHTDLLCIETLLKGEPLAQIPEISANEPAYIIMTSGTTGAPKGVQICHKGAVNTINDVNKRCGITHKDSVLGVSAMDFDLSVYDLFGILGVGATLVTIPEERSRDAEFWLEQVNQYGVTVWNSVPTLLEMLLICAQAQNKTLPLQVIMLSGDWIGLDLPERAANLTDHCRLISMGGATEASIWSNFFEVKLPLPQNWSSIPYGRPLAGQSYRVVNEFGEDVPFWSEGELWIGGAGVGSYRGDAELTGKKFVEESGTTWYKTGDKGRFWNDGTIEFLGRTDFQVKIRGHRIELGETESALRQIPGITAAVAEVADSATQGKHLVAFLETGTKKTAPLFQTDAEILKETERICTVLSSLKKAKFTENTYGETMTFANTQVCAIILKLFQTAGIFIGKQAYTQQEIHKKLGILPEYTGVVEQYLRRLSEQNILIECGNDSYRMAHSEPKLPPRNSTEEDIANYLQRLEPYIGKMLSGEEPATDIFYAREKNLSPGELFGLLPGVGRATETFIEGLKKLCAAFKGKVRIAEIGTRNPALTKRLTEALQDYSAAYTYLDSSAYFTKEVTKLQKDCAFFTTKTLDFAQEQYDFPEFDIIIAVNYLHRTDVKQTVQNLYRALSPSGMVCVLEMTESNALQHVTAALLEKGNVQILPLSAYRAALKEASFDRVFNLFEAAGCSVFFAATTQKSSRLNRDYLVQHLGETLPDYMIPRTFHALERLPLSRNGKIDRKALQKLAAREKAIPEQTAPVTKTQTILSEIWCELFGMEQVGIHDNYYRLGGDSLTAIQMTTQIKKAFPITYSIKDAMSDHTIARQAQTIEKRIQQGDTIVAEREQTIVADPERLHLPFPLTDVQNAYFLGRSGNFSLGGVSTHCYFELDGKEIDITRANAALNELIQYHGAARIVIHSDGTQSILQQVPQYQMQVYDLTGTTEQARKQKLHCVRSEMSHQKIDLATWPLFDIRAAMFEGGFKLFISFDNIIFDGFSMFQVLSEWAERYRGTYEKKEPLAISFRDYVLGLERLKASAKYKQDKAYWLERSATFLPAPALPLQKNEEAITQQTFERRAAYLRTEEWECLQQRARELEITPSVLLLTAYAEVLRSRSANAEFTLNLTQFDRKELHEQVHDLLGDFTTLTLLEIKTAKCKSFLERARAIGKQLAEDLAHSDYSAVDFQRELRRQTQNAQKAIMPVVFTSGLGIRKWSKGSWLGELSYNISQTPQVWLDHQVIETERGLELFWDSIAELFYPGFIQEMFEDYVRLLKNLAQEKSLFTQKTPSLVQVRLSKERIAANQTQKAFPQETLDGMFLRAAHQYPNRTAVVCNGETLTYRELKEKALAVFARLKEKNIEPQEPVAIYAPKGIAQIIAALGILFAGGAYLPLDFENPQERIETILKAGGVRKVIVSEIPESGHFLSGYDLIAVHGASAVSLEETLIPKKNPDALCYVIYTSGSTGAPKGVMITHAGAVNTIQDVNERFGLRETDACLGVSNLHFDLSVYDIFGLLAVGGRVVLPTAEQAKEPASWAKLLEREQITVWNSVPAFAEMLSAYYEQEKLTKPHSLRLMLLSGDWIATDLPGKIYELFPQLRLIALGGATEASIWSNFFQVPRKIPKEWNSIPYGKPLSNQRYYILDEALQNRPDWVTGNIFIAGKGVAKGYFHNKEQTARQFITHPHTKEPMYATGDLGRYWSDGTIEFLGRKDNQIKINGYRVEIGEIEAALNKIEGVSGGKILYQAGILTAFFHFANDYTEAAERQIKAALTGTLPAYMLPQVYIPLAEYPLTANGKTDLAKLGEISESHRLSQQIANNRKPQTTAEIQLAEIWGNLLKYAPVYAQDDFFQSGGDSLKAIYLVNAIKKQFGVTLTVKEIYTGSRLCALAEQIRQRPPQQTGNEELFEI